MAEPRAFTNNAADQQQVREARNKERRALEQEQADVRAVLDTPQGRRVLWRVLQHCQVFGSVFEPSARIYYNSGKQDVGHFLLKVIAEAQPDAYAQMVRDAYEQEQRNHG